MQIEILWLSYQLVETFPVILRHEAECTQQRPAKVVKAGKAVIWILTNRLALISFRTRAAINIIIYQQQQITVPDGDTQSFNP